MNILDRSLSGVALPKKFALVLSVLILAIVALLVQLELQTLSLLRTTQNEISGSHSLKSLNTLIDQTQRHRGLHNRKLGGDESASGQADAVRNELRISWGQFAQGQSASWTATQARTTQLRNTWESLQAQLPQLSAAQSFDKHSQLVEELISLGRVLADESELTLDPEMPTYYLMSNSAFTLPLAGEYLAKIRGKVSGALANSNPPDMQILQQALGYHQVLISEAHDLQESLAKVQASNVVLKASLAEDAKAANQAIESMGVTLNGLIQSKVQTTPEAFFKLGSDAVSKVHVYQDSTLDSLRALLEERAQSLSLKLWVTLIGSVLMLVACAVMAYLIFSGLSLRIQKVLEHSQWVAQGDLTRPLLLKSKDEVGRMAVSVENIRTFQSGLVQQLQSTASQLVSTSRTLAESSATVRNGAMHQTDSAGAVAASIEEMTVSISQIASHARDAHDMTAEVGEYSQQGRSSVAVASSSMEQIGQASTELAQTIHDLGESSRSISTIVQVIHDIANQTNLLALNAAIEAARAGDQGRGFAVVADEVRKLAEKTSSSTSQISDLISTIQTEAESAVAQVSSWGEMISNGKTQSTRADSVMVDIQERASSASGAVNEISNSIREQSEASNLIAQQVEKIARMTEESNLAIQEVDQVVRSIEQFSTNIQNQVNQFKA
ncbi:MAG: methyl-accepting chemotaxis protein [Limnobacter sp.]|nr:methyl-accepting chemotaxis protein [Limnobacter sp.]